MENKSQIDHNLAQVNRFVVLSNERNYDELVKDVLHPYYYSDLARDDDVMNELVSEKVLNTIANGASGFVERHKLFTSAFPDAKMTIIDQIAQGETVWLQTESEGTFTGAIDIGGTIFRPHGDLLKWGGMVKIQMKEGRILTSSVLMDNFAYLQGIAKGVLTSNDPAKVESYMASLKNLGLIA